MLLGTAFLPVLSSHVLSHALTLVLHTLLLLLSAPLLLDSSAARDVVAKAEANNGYLFLALQRDPDQEDASSADDLYEVGVITRIVKTLKLPDGSQSAMTQGVRRARLVKVVRERPHLFVRVKQMVEIPTQGERAESMFRLLQTQLQQLAQLQEQSDSGFATALLNVEDPGQLADFTAGVVRKIEDRQRLLMLSSSHRHSSPSCTLSCSQGRSAHN